MRQDIRPLGILELARRCLTDHRQQDGIFISFFSIPPPSIEVKSTRGAFCAVTRKIFVHHSFALRHCYIYWIFQRGCCAFFFHFAPFERAMRWQNRGSKKRAVLFVWLNEAAKWIWTLNAHAQRSYSCWESKAWWISGYATVWSRTSSRLHTK